MPTQLFVIVVVKAFDGCFLDGAVHPFDLTIGPWVLYLREPVLDAVFATDAVEDAKACWSRLRWVN